MSTNRLHNRTGFTDAEAILETAWQQKILNSTAVLMVWTACSGGLVVGWLFYFAGWIPEHYSARKGDAFPLMAAAIWSFLSICNVVNHYFRFHALVMDDVSASRTVDRVQTAVSGIFAFAILSGLIAMYGMFASILLEGFSIRPSVSVSGAIGLATVGAIFGLSVLARWKGRYLTADSSGSMGAYIDALAILVFPPLAAAIGWLAYSDLLMMLTLLRIDYEPLRLLTVNHWVAWTALLTVAFIALSAAVARGVNVYRQSQGIKREPNFPEAISAVCAATVIAQLLLIVLTMLFGSK